MDKAIRHGEVLGNESPESGLLEKRQASRHITTLRVAKLATEASEALCIVRNASSGGMMIEALLAFEPGQTVTVHLSDEQQVSGSVAWHRDGLTGVKFDAIVDIDGVLAKPVPRKNGKKPRLPRLAIQCPAELKVGIELKPAQVCDISQRGARLNLQTQLEANEQVTILIRGFRPVKGWVRWVRDHQAGVIFNELVSISELMEWLRDHQKNES